jgi:hypothetical protein
MSFTVTVAQSIRDGSTTHSTSTEHTCESVIKIEETIADSTSDQEIGFAVDVSAMQACSIYSDQALTIKTNDSSSPQETIALSAGEHIVFQSGGSAPFSDDVTALFVSNASGSTATLKIMVGLNLV